MSGQVPHPVQAGVADPGLVGAPLDLGQVALRAPGPEKLIEFGAVPDPVAVVRVPRVLGEIGTAEQIPRHVEVGWLGQVEGLGLLAVVQPHEMGGHAPDDAVVVPGRVTGTRLFDLDHPGAEVGQVPGAQRGRDGLLESEDGNAGQRRLVSGRGRQVAAGFGGHAFYDSPGESAGPANQDDNLVLAGMIPLRAASIAERTIPMTDEEQGTSGALPRLVQEFTGQLREATERLQGLYGLGERLPPAPGPFPLPGALSAAEMTSITDSIAAQRRSVQALQAQLSAFDEQLAALEQILGPLAEWSRTWAEFEQRLLNLGRRPEAGS